LLPDKDKETMTAKDQFNIRLDADVRKIVHQIAEEEQMSYAHIARQLLTPAVTLAQRYGFFATVSALRQEANEAAPRKKTRRPRLPIKSSKRGGPKLRFG
jgi:hypothetical protein